MLDQINTYYQRLLNAQYDVSEIFEHLLTRGEMREDFFKDLIKKRKQDLNIEKGILFDEQGNQSPQCDVMIGQSCIAVERLGSHGAIRVEDCSIILEVKSNASGRDIKEADEKSGVIKNLDSCRHPRCGIFCYKYDLKKSTLLKRFGYKYDKDIRDFYDDGALSLEYSNIDFVLAISIEEEEHDGDLILKQVFLIKNIETGRYNLFLDYPAIRHFWRLIDGL